MLIGDWLSRYVKGARSERELMEMFMRNGYSVMRSAGSGVNSITPDVISYKKGRGMAFECKAWNNGSISIEPEKFDVLKRWQDNTSMETFIAWKMNNMGWFFIRLGEMSRSQKNYTVTKKNAIKIGRVFESIV